MKTSRKAKLLKLSGFVAGYSPITAIVVANWDTYVSTPERTFSLSMGMVILGVIATFSAIGKAKTLFGSGYTTMLIAFGIVTALMPLIQEAQLILGALIAGQSIQKGVFGTLYKSELKKIQEAVEQGKLKQQEQVIEQTLNKWSGRV